MKDQSIHYRKKGEVRGCTYRISAKAYKTMIKGDKTLELGAVGRTKADIIAYLNSSLGLKQPIYKLEIDGIDY
jgi:riboflavin synthase